VIKIKKVQEKEVLNQVNAKVETRKVIVKVINMDLKSFYKQIYNTATVLTLDKYDEGWVDTGKIITFKEAINKLKNKNM